MYWHPLISLRTNLFAALVIASIAPAIAQPPSRGDRGGGRFGGFGDRGDREERGGGRFGGGSRDRDDRRGRSRRGGRGGFDPSSMLQRFDRNDNGMIDMDERDGPVGFMIERLKRENPDLNTDRPIPLDKVTESFQRRRGGGRSRGRSSDDTDALETDVLVPGFGIPPELMPGPVMGFGPAAELFDVDIRPEDIQEAEERLRRYDRNRDGVLTANEVSRRWEGDPMDFDRNKDGKLAASELAIRYARRREGSEENERRSRATNRRDEGRDNRGRETPDPYEGRKSLRLGGGQNLEGLPNWFSERDANEDGQVMMSEYSSKWSDDLVAEFFRFDLNQDGTITASEASVAQNDGISPNGPAPDRSEGSPAMTPHRRSASSDRTDESATSAPPAELDEKYLRYAKQIISRMDENEDGVLVAAEWKGGLIDPQPADSNRDGRITVEEYGGWLQNRQADSR